LFTYKEVTLAKLVPEVVVTSKSPGVLPVSVVRYVQPLPSVIYDSPVAPVAPVAPEPDPPLVKSECDVKSKPVLLPILI